jgi:hypothetical protein
MTIFLVITYVVKPDKLGEYAAWVKKWAAWAKERPDLYKEFKSGRLFRHRIGNFGGFVEMWEMESLADVEKWTNRASADKDRMTKIMPEFMTLIVPGTMTVNIWGAELKGVFDKGVLKEEP